MDMDLTDYGLRSIMDHDLDYDNNVFPPSPPQPQDSAGSPQDYAGSSPLPTGRPRSSSTPMLQPGNYKSYGAAYKLVPMRTYAVSNSSRTCAVSNSSRTYAASNSPRTNGFCFKK